MASMVLASSPLSAQSFVKLGTNSIYPRSSYFVPSPSKANNSYLHLSYKNISDIESSKSLFTKGDGFSFSLPKFSRVASTLSPSLNIIKASSGEENIYHFPAYDVKTGEYILLGDRYRGKVLLIVNIPQQGSGWTNSEIRFLNDLRKRHKDESYRNGFEVLGFLHDKDELNEKSGYGWGEQEILDSAEFPIFGKVALNDNHESFFRGLFTPNTVQKKKDEDLWYFLRNTPIGGEKIIKKIEQEFEKILVDGNGLPMHHYPRFDGETLASQPVQPGGDPGLTAGPRLDPRFTIQNDIDVYFPELRRRGHL